MAKEKWFVEIVSYETGAIERTLGPYQSERFADRADSGVNRNLDTVRYWTRTVEASAR